MNSSSPPSGNTRDDLRDELRGDAQTLTHAAGARLQNEADNRKSAVTDQAKTLSSALEKVAGEMGDDVPNWLKSAFSQGAQSLSKLAETANQRDSRQLIGNVQDFAKQNPTTFLTGCAALGFAAARVFKAGESAAADTTSGSPGASNRGPEAASGETYAPSNGAAPLGQDAAVSPAVPLLGQDAASAASRYQV